MTESATQNWEWLSLIMESEQALGLLNSKDLSEKLKSLSDLELKGFYLFCAFFNHMKACEQNKAKGEIGNLTLFLAKDIAMFEMQNRGITL